MESVIIYSVLNRHYLTFTVIVTKWYLKVKNGYLLHLYMYIISSERSDEVWSDSILILLETGAEEI